MTEALISGSDADALLSAVLQLPIEKRVRVAEQLVENITQEAADGNEGAFMYKDEWIAECQRRLERYDRGETKAVDGEEVFRRLRAKHRS